jgi:cytochrome c553
MKQSGLICLFLLLSHPASGADELHQALSLEGDVSRGEKIYQLCSTCHYATGWGHPDGSFPAIAGQYRRVLIKQLADIRARERDNPTMYPFADPAVIGGVQAVADVAEYIARLPPNPAPGVGSGDAVKRGEVLYHEHCLMCHGNDGQGDADAYYPRLTNQHFEYLRRQLRWIRDNRRRNANVEMVRRVRGMSDADLDALSDYLSRLR